MKKIHYFAFLLYLSFLVSCAGTRTMVTQVSDASYLIFIGNKSMSQNDFGYYIENKYEAKIDDKITFDIKLTKNGKDLFVKSTVFQITPGTHNIKVYRNGSIVINKNIFISNQETMQIELL
jgi:flagellar assembly factor FliW